MNLVKNLCVLLLATLMVAACSTSKKVAEAAKPSGPAGTWSAVVSGTPMGDVNAEMVLLEEGNGYKGYVLNNGARLNMENVKVEGNKLSASFFYREAGGDILMDVTYNPDTDTLEGWVMDQFRIKGERKPEPK